MKGKRPTILQIPNITVVFKTKNIFTGITTGDCETGQKRTFIYPYLDRHHL
jgi:hypothetical protein